MPEIPQRSQEGVAVFHGLADPKLRGAAQRGVNDLNATEPWESWFIREIITKWPKYSGELRPLLHIRSETECATTALILVSEL